MKRFFTSLFSLSALIFSLGVSAQGDGPFVEVDSGTDVDLESVYFPTPMVGYAGGDFITLLKTTDGGFTWETLEISGITTPGFNDDPIIDLYFSDEMHGYMIVENFSAIYETLDGGLNWVALSGPPGDLCFPRALAPLANEGLLLGGQACFGGNAVAQLQGGLWDDMSNILEGDDSHITDIDNFGDVQTIIASTNGAIYRSANNHTEWEKIVVNADVELTDVHFLTGSDVYATSDDLLNPLYVSDNGGATWEATDMPFAGFTVSLKGVLGGPNFLVYGADGEESGGFVSTVSSGEPIVQAFDEPLNAGFTNGEGVHFLVGESGIILRSEIFVSTEDPVSKNEFITYPNPAMERIYFSNIDFNAGDLRYRLVSILGQETAKGPILSEGIRVDGMKSGIYFLEVFRSGISIGTRRVVIQ